MDYATLGSSRAAISSLHFGIAGGVAERMPVLARELVDLKPDVLIAAPESSLAAVRALTTTVPILTIWLRESGTDWNR